MQDKSDPRETPNPILLYGTAEPVPATTKLVAGPLSLDLVDGAARDIRWNGVEVLRAIDCPVRAENWATCSSHCLDEKVTKSPDHFELIQKRAVAGGALTCTLTFQGRSDGNFRAAVELVARDDFRTNRAGFTVLHPLDGVTGSPVEVVHGRGSSTTTEFPAHISPSQVAFDIAGLDHTVHGVRTSIRFKGEIFEMEDQRNWSDASFKTYCRPLSLPIPYVLKAGEAVTQEIEVRLTGGEHSRAARTGSDASEGPLSLAGTSEAVPTVALALDEMSIPSSAELHIARALKPRILQLRLTGDTCDAVLASAREWAGDQVEFELEVVIPRDRDVDAFLAEIADRCRRTAIKASRVLALPEAYLRSYQPDGQWPDGPTPRDACIAARRHFTQAQIGSGILANFTELNRCRPDITVCDYISHGSTAVVHAADDRSVVQSLEGLRHIYASARALAQHRDYRPGLISIGMRSNPYGADVAPNPDQIRLTMARIDPRQRGLFAAAWAVGAVAATERHAVSALALAMPVGPFGVVYRRAEWPQPFFDEISGTPVYPLFHAVAALSQMAGSRRLAVRGLPAGVASVASESARGAQIILANLSSEWRRIPLPVEGNVRRLGQDNFRHAVETPDWLTSERPSARRQVDLGPYNVAIVELAGSAAP